MYGGKFLEAGSSPLARGGPASGSTGRPPARLIPARAGRTLHPDTVVLIRRAHPRSRGEDGQFFSLPGSEQGSSPLARGGPTTPAASSTRIGLIPARAGRT